MRAFVALALIVPLLAGCFGDDKADLPAPATRIPLSAADIHLPDGADLEPIAGGFAAVWASANLPFSSTITVPEHATMVRLVSEVATTSAVGMSNTETGRRRCNNPTVDSFSDGFAVPKSCSSATALDSPGTEWNVGVSGTGSGKVRVEYLDLPLDGLLADLDLSLIDPPALGVKDTLVQFVPSFDGVLLRVEVTLPEGDGPWPVVIESSPYHDDGIRLQPSSYAYFVEDWARRGYAIVTADVRGFGDSGGCVEVWGPNEQADQKFLVDWAAEQAWSDGNIGFYGQSYVGTTPVEAAVQAPEALKAIIAVAPVINSYEDWHYGGVPNGESTGSPAAYQVLTDATVTGLPGAVQEQQFRTDPVQLANNLGNGLCDPTLAARANDPRATYGPFYEERDFKKRAGEVKAAVLYTQGFEDANVKGAMIPGWFNSLTSPKLGLFGHFLHQHPPRLDCEVLMVAWMEQYLKHKPIGLETLPAAAIQVDRETERYAEEWPPLDPIVTALYPDLDGNTLGPTAADGNADLLLDHSAMFPRPETLLEYRTTLSQDVSLAGSATMHVTGSLVGAGTAYLMAELYADDSLLTFGQVNLAHNADHTEYSPVLPGQAISVDMPFRPTERVLRAGTLITLLLHGVAVADATDPFGAGGVQFTFTGGEDGTRLLLPGADLADYQPIALSSQP